MKTQKLLNSFMNGNQISSAQITSRFGLKNPTAAVTYLRQLGYPIYFNKRKNSTSTYRLGNPTRAAMQFAFNILGAQESGLSR